MYEGVFVIALRCTPCKTGQERVYSGAREENIFCKGGNKIADTAWNATLRNTCGRVALFRQGC